MLVPFAYLVARAAEADPATLAALVWRPRTLELLGNTLQLGFAVAALGTLIALPLAWLTVRTDLPARRLMSYLAVMPLAVPGYVMAYALIGLSGYYGPFNQFFGVMLPRLQGLPGATLALALYTFPYIYLNLRAALLGLDPSLEETARSLGRSRLGAFRAVVLPHLLPALLSGWLVVTLYVLGDFGAVALMRYETFSFAIYNQYAGAFDRVYAAALSLILMALAGAILLLEGRLSRGRFGRTGTGVSRAPQTVPLGPWRWPAAAGCVLVQLASLGLPLLVILFWLTRSPAEIDWAALGPVAGRTALAALPAALLAALLALPVALLAARHEGPLARTVERLSYFGYAVPPLAFALAAVFFALSAAPVLYQTLPLLVLAYAFSFLALAVGPVRSALLQMGTRPEEAARSLGRGPLAAFAGATLPRLARPMTAGALLVFTLVVKELPITFLLAPTGYTTLAMNIFSRTNEGMLLEAAPYALATILFSSFFVGLIMRHEGGRR